MTTTPVWSCKFITLGRYWAFLNERNIRLIFYLIKNVFLTKNWTAAIYPQVMAEWQRCENILVGEWQAK